MATSQMPPNGPEARHMRSLENAMALRLSAREHLRCVCMRMLNSARTREDQDNIRELLQAQGDLDELRIWLRELHPHPYEEAT